jgi:HPt (histidine-containing phosphotransfer) domain-containing protein
MDYARALREFENDEIFLREVIQGFLDAVDGQLRILDRALADGDAGTVAREAHAIKGGAANLTADGLAAIARELESMGRRGFLETGPETLAGLEREHGRLKAYVEERET